MHGTPLMFLSIRESAHGGIKIFEGPYLKFRSVSSHLSGVTDNFWTLEIILWNIATPVVVIPLTVHLEFYQCDFGVDGEIKELENWCISIEGVQFSEKKEITAPGVSGARNGGLVLVEKKREAHSTFTESIINLSCRRGSMNTLTDLFGAKLHNDDVSQLRAPSSKCDMVTKLNKNVIYYFLVEKSVSYWEI